VTAPPSTRSIGRLVAAAMSGVLAISLMAVALPRLTGTSWHAMAGRMATLSLQQIAVLTIVWLTGLFVHTYVMIASVPRLSHRRAMMLNFSGSAVANTVPFGGVVGMGLTYSMLRSWGFSRREFGIMTLLTNAWTMVTKLVLPSLAVGSLVLVGHGLGRNVLPSAIVGLVIVGLGAALAAANRARRDRAGSSNRIAFTRRVVSRILPTSAGETITAFRREAGTIVHQRWRQLTLGALGYSVLQALLLGLCLHAFGTRLSPVDVFAGFAVGSLLTLVPITPGGLGVSETGMAALLIALGGDPAATTAAVLLFRTFTFLLEIPAGAVCTAAWWLRRATRNAALPDAVALPA
jgi:uncharacterized protein (TIRG00374 family)